MRSYESRLTVTLEPCGTRFQHRLGLWSAVLPVQRLPSWIALYRALRDRKNGRYSQHYAAQVQALEALARALDPFARAPGAAEYQECTS